MEKRNFTRFKSCHVGKGRNLQEDIEKLSKDMQDLWTQRNFEKFLDKFSSLLDKRPFPPGIEAILPFLPELSISFHREIHKKIGECYKKCKDFADETEDETGLVRTMACSSNSYLRRTITKNLKTCPASAQSLELSTYLLKEQDIEEQTFNVRDGNDEESPRNLRDFIKKLYYYPLKLAMTKKELFPSKPGVYLIFYIGENELYPGSQVDALLPVYVGQSKKGISDRLYSHHSKIKKARNLDVTDFVVQFMIVDGENFVDKIESTLIKRFSPVWNTSGTKETPGFSFGSGDKEHTLWNKCHIQADKETLDTIVERLSIKDNGPNNEA